MTRFCVSVQAIGYGFLGFIEIISNCGIVEKREKAQ